MEPRIISPAELAKEQFFKSKLKELEIQFAKPIKCSIWKGLEPDFILENGNELDSSQRDKVFELYNQIFKASTL